VLPSPAQILAFIADTSGPAGKREIARAFGLLGEERIALKAVLSEMEDAGQLDRTSGRAFHPGGALPKVAVIRVAEIASDGAAFAVPDNWEQAAPPPRIRLIERGRQGAPGIGDRMLARIEQLGTGYRAHPMKRLASRAEAMLGVLQGVPGRWFLAPTDKKVHRETPVSDPGEAKVGDLVLAEPHGRGIHTQARVTEVLGDPFAPRAFSLIAIHAKRIPHVFPPAAMSEADEASTCALGPREDLTALPFLTVDPADARDHDDAVWAEADADRPGHWRAIVAIADVSWFVRPHSALDREARLRGNSVYFPDQVVPMLPHALSSDACSLVAGASRAVLACHLAIGPDGKITAHRFTRATIRCVTNIAYEDAQATIDRQAGEYHAILAPLWDAWRALAAARAARAPLDLDLPERRVTLGTDGQITEVGVRQRLDAHRLIEEYMIAANVAAAQTLDAHKAPCVYRDHEAPGREKLIAFRDYLKTFGINFALGQVIFPATFNRILTEVKGRDEAEQIGEQVLRTQTQAYYAATNTGHFGLSLGQYAHFTSPIRRYSDLIVHRALVTACKLGQGGLAEDEVAVLPRTCEHISQTERRAMEAERDTMDRYIAQHLGGRVGEIVDARITGVARFGVFAQLEGIGGDGILPMSALGDERFHFDEAARAIEGERSGDRYTIGQRLKLRLVEANPITGALRFEQPEGGYGRSSDGRRDRRTRRGR